ncbi:unnamed protein product, partial [Vitis vinifera]
MCTAPWREPAGSYLPKRRRPQTTLQLLSPSLFRGSIRARFPTIPMHQHNQPATVPATVLSQGEKPFIPFSAELLAVMQEMIRKEVRNYMAGLEQNGVCLQADGIRNAAVKRIGISKIE